MFKKLNWKNHDTIVVINAPESFRPEVQALQDLDPALSVVEDEKSLAEIDFGLFFAPDKATLDRLSHLAADRLKGDGVLWFAYPKGSSRKYHCDFNRDRGWDILESAGFRGVRQISIDEDWSALRFRRQALVKRVPLEPVKTERTPGLSQGKGWISPDFDDTLEENLLREFET